MPGMDGQTIRQKFYIFPRETRSAPVGTGVRTPAALMFILFAWKI